ncbi:molybdate transport system ATP-binding protein [Pustulibacterium marinum]|uniref:Molybdate transport system ATP-binding protein n=1 Tax=Pustulibacterium marinum TaxID=1224947 RepID=A0A1I7F890_9FLAO|nr:ATP-binding cassette domain-containing protein [Pustulibacterium marinum]SFU32390.1 molybdate transport system ATP-binding protein [Pustulibacterium marinum]
MESVLIFHNNQTNTHDIADKLRKNQFSEIELKSISNIKVYNPKALEAFIREEEIHDTNVFNTTGQPIKTMSGGEQKKAMLNYLVTQAPEVLILDNPFDHLDLASQEALKNRLEKLAEKSQIIVLASRKEDAPNFISKKYKVENDSLIPFEDSGNSETIHADIQIPEPIIHQTFEAPYLIQLKNVSVSYGEKHILKDINWNIKPGEFWQLIGPNGSGKTTILSMITGDNVKGYGQDLFLFGKKKGTGETVWELKEKIGYFTTALTQQFNGNNTTLEMVIGGFFDAVGLYNKATDLQKQIAFQWLKVINLENEINTRFRNLSLGKQRMVMIARAMVKHPLLLILDEPTTGLDDENAQLLVSFINKIAAESKTTILYVSHRKETGLQPDYNFTLQPTIHGSEGFIN